MIAHLKFWMELAYFASGIVIAVAAVYGLKQIRLVKTDIRIRNERAAKESAIGFGRQYLRSYVGLQGVFSSACKNEGLDSYSGPIGNFTAESILLNARTRTGGEKRYALASWLPAMNELEAIAAAFTSGVADEGLGFKIIGRSFCRSVEYNYDLIALSRHETAQGYWTNIVQLYRMWSPRLEELELRQAKDDLESRLSVAASRTTKIPPIGTV